MACDGTYGPLTFLLDQLDEKVESLKGEIERLDRGRDGGWSAGVTAREPPIEGPGFALGSCSALELLREIASL
jgi:hypothetical protein